MVMEWISLDFAQPSNDRQRCLIVDEAGGVYIARWDLVDMEFKDESDLPFAGITHWNRLPEPPK